GAAITWPSAFLLNADGRRVALVGTGDVTQVQAGGVWQDVRGYVAGPREKLLEVFEEWRPEAIGVTWSPDDDSSDGITYGWYWLKDGEKEAPEPVRRAFAATLGAIDAGMAMLRPGHAGYEVDAESRRSVIEAGFPEPGFAFGHHVGRVAHDGAGTLGPRWER